MTTEEALAWLAADPPQTGKLATVRADGRPHVAPIWFAVDGDSIVFETGADSVKGTSLRRDGRLAMCVDDPAPPFTFVTVEGRAEVSEDPEQVLHWAGVIGGRYMGAERAGEFAARNGVPGELLVRVRITKVIGLRDLAD